MYQNTDDQDDFSIGAVVALKTHPFLSSHTNIIISGDTSHISPLMVVIEKQKIYKAAHDEYTSVKGDTLQLKCMFYSSKDQFEEVWFASSLLKIIEIKFNGMSVDEYDIKNINDSYSKKLVSLKTIEAELGKKKSYLRGEAENLASSKMRLEGFLTYLSPVMQILEIKRYDHKDALYDIKNGKQKRFVSKWIAKCKWFNSDSNKFCEKLIPMEALSLIPEITTKTIDLLETHIIAGKYFVIEKSEKQNTLIRPQSISYQSGFYLLNYTDLIDDNFRHLRILNEDQFENSVESALIDTWPNFHYQEGEVVTHEILQKNLIELINKMKGEKLFIKLRYKNRFENISVRSISNYELIIVEEENSKIQYLTGYCHLRKQDRTFRLDRIEKLEVLNLNY